MFNCRTLAEAAARRDRILADYAEEAPQACERLGAGFDDAMTVMRLPEQMRRCARTSNCLERLNKEIKRRSNVIGVFPNAGSVIRLVGALLMEENDRWAAMSKAYYSTGVAELEGEAGGARRDSKGAGEAHVRGLAGGGGGWEFTHRYGLDLLELLRGRNNVAREA